MDKNSAAWDGNIVVCWFGLWVLPISFARTLLCAIPADDVSPSFAYSAERMLEAIADAAASRLMQPQSQENSTPAENSASVPWMKRYFCVRNQC